MKKIVYNIFLIVSVAITFASCKKYLDQQPITSFDENYVFSDVNSARQAIAGAYSRLTGDQGYGIRLSLYYTVDNDEMQGPTGNADNDRRDIARFIATPQNAQLERPFNQLFTGIEYANICILNIPAMDLYSNGTEQQKKQLQRMYGEALALRAQYYFEAIRNWGDLPMHFEPAYKLYPKDPFPKRVSSDTLYDRIIKDLELAASLVPWRNEITNIGDVPDERLTKGSIKALRARIALFRGGFALRQTGGMQRSADYLTYYNIAKQECNDIINSGQHGLNPNYRSLWKDVVCAHAATDPQGELMFQVTGIGLNAVADTKLGYYNGPSVNGLGNRSINPLLPYFYSFDNNDLRRDVTIAPYNVAANGVTKVGQTSAAMNDGKYRRDWITNPSFAPTDQVQYFGLKWQIIRYSDVLLMLAEAENELNGPTSLAYNAINMVRRRGFGKPINTPDASVDLPAGLSKAAFFDAVVRERSFELGGEGVRKYDLIRWNLLGAKIAETRATLTAMFNATGIYASYPTRMFFRNNSTADDRTLWANSFTAPSPSSTPTGTTGVNWINAILNTTVLQRFATGYTAGKSELLPLPQAAIDANFNLKQNPGY